MLRCVLANRFAVAGQEVTFVGREPQTVSAELKKALVGAGIASENVDGTVYYSGALFVRLLDGTKVSVPESNMLNLRLTELHTSRRSLVVEEP